MSSFFYIALFAVGIILLSAGERLGVQLSRAGQTAAAKMSKISWGIYLNHKFVFNVFKFLIPKYQPLTLPIYLFVVIIYSMFTMVIVDYIMRLLRRVFLK